MPPAGQAAARASKYAPAARTPRVAPRSAYAHEQLPQRLTAPIYRDVWKASGLPGRAPRVYQMPQNSLGFQPNYSRGVFINPVIARGMKTLPGSVRDMQALNVLLHEYAHVGQPTAIKPKLMEAGADIWSMRNVNRVAQRLGVPNRAIRLASRSGDFENWPRFGYPNLSMGLFGKPGSESFVERGQFGRR